MSRLEEFKNFYLRVVLPNTPSYKNYLNEGNFDKNINELIEKYKGSYGFNPFEEGISLKDLETSATNNTFQAYSDSIGSGVPKAIINTHYRKFLEYEEDVYFENLQEVIDRIHEELKKDNFIEKFQKTRIKLNGNSRVASKTALFAGATDPKNDDWTFNIGSTKELQYHLLYRVEGLLHYGLKFSAYQERFNLSPVEEIQPFIKSYFNEKEQVKTLLTDYTFYTDDMKTDIESAMEQSLKEIKVGEGVLLGKVLKVEEDADGDTYIKGSSFLELIYDLKGKQFETYKLIFSKANLMKTNDIKTEKELQKYTDLLRYKSQIILQGPPGTGKTREAKRIAKALLGLGENDNLEGNEQFKLIQFHPSYSYEDFVRGIVAENTNGNISYVTKDKILAEFAKKALNKLKKAIKWEDFRDFLQEKSKNEDVYFSDKIKLDRIESYKDGNSSLYFLVKKDEKWIPNEKMIHFSNFSQKNLDDNFENFYNIYEKGYWKSITDYFIEWSNAYKNFVLVIDEINRANLSAVLGELIYALEYRGEAVESMYAIEGDNKLVLPKNLYIIGTMNTADRSVGHIDYAIRRRFAFVNVLPKDLSGELGKLFNSELFNQVSELFDKNLSREFKKEDVQLGHSYFITEDTPIEIRWEYEIKPILLEYVKDGILVGEEIESTINSLYKDENSTA